MLCCGVLCCCCVDVVSILVVCCCGVLLCFCVMLMCVVMCCVFVCVVLICIVVRCVVVLLQVDLSCVVCCCCVVVVVVLLLLLLCVGVRLCACVFSPLNKRNIFRLLFVLLTSDLLHCTQFVCTNDILKNNWLCKICVVLLLCRCFERLFCLFIICLIDLGPFALY